MSKMCLKCVICYVQAEGLSSLRKFPQIEVTLTRTPPVRTVTPERADRGEIVFLLRCKRALAQ